MATSLSLLAVGCMCVRAHVHVHCWWVWGRRWGGAGLCQRGTQGHLWSCHPHCICRTSEIQTNDVNNSKKPCGATLSSALVSKLSTWCLILNYKRCEHLMQECKGPSNSESDYPIIFLCANRHCTENSKQLRYYKKFSLNISCVKKSD